MVETFADLAFSKSVKAVQEKLGSRAANQELVRRQKDRNTNILTPALATYLSQCRSFYLASASKKGQPYMQHRGGPEGFIHILDSKTIAFADFPGNKQYISLGNLDENPRVLLFVMNYADRQRIKIWGNAKVISRDEDETLVEKLTPQGSNLSPARAIKIVVGAWDINCPAHIPELYPADQVAGAIAKYEHRISQLEAELAKVRKKR